MQEQVDKANELASDWDGKSDSYLKEKYRDGTTVEKMAATKLLKQRGYKMGGS